MKLGRCLTGEIWKNVHNIRYDTGGIHRILSRTVDVNLHIMIDNVWDNTEFNNRVRL